MPRERNLGFKVGLFVLIALICLVVFIFSINDTSVFKEGNTYRVIFSFADGLKKGAPVRVAGVDQGIVREVSLFFDKNEDNTKVEVLIQVNADVMIPVDSVVMVNQLGMMGEKYLEIIPGKDRENYFTQKNIYLGKDSVPQAYLSERMITLLRKTENTIDGINDIVRNKENIDALTETLRNLSLVTKGFDDLLSDLRDSKGTLGMLIYDGALYEDLRGLTSDLRGLTSDLRQNPWKILYRPKESKRREKNK